MKESQQAGSTRREFLRRTVWAGAGLVVLARPLRGADAAGQPAPGVTTATARTFISRLQPAVAGGFRVSP
jgi:hypothetical protein